MSIIEVIQQWSISLPEWQQDAITRLFFKGELSPEDDNQLYALLKASQGIPLADGVIVQKLAADQVPATPAVGLHVELLAIKNLSNVNALAEGQSLAVAQAGLTVIYGANGSGKSGYSRVLKKACRARDQSEVNFTRRPHRSHYHG